MKKNGALKKLLAGVLAVVTVIGASPAIIVRAEEETEDSSNTVKVTVDSDCNYETFSIDKAGSEVEISGTTSNSVTKISVSSLAYGNTTEETQSDADITGWGQRWKTKITLPSTQTKYIFTAFEGSEEDGYVECGNTEITMTPYSYTADQGVEPTITADPAFFGPYKTSTVISGVCQTGAEEREVIASELNENGVQIKTKYVITNNPIVKVVYSKTELSKEEVLASTDSVTTISSDINQYSFELPLDLSGVTADEGYYLYAVDSQNVVSNATMATAYYDKIAPFIDSTVGENGFDIEAVEDTGLIACVARFFGIHYGSTDKYRIKVYVKDEQSGVSDVELTYDAEQISFEKSQGSDEKGSYYQFVGTFKNGINKAAFSAVVIDNVGNRSDLSENVILQMDTTSPEVTIDIKADEFLGNNGCTYITEDFAFDVNISDDISGIEKYEIKVDDKVIHSYTFDEYSKTATFKATAKILEGFKIDTTGEARHKVEVTVYDNTGSEHNKAYETKTVFRDNTAPTINSIYTKTETTDENNEVKTEKNQFCSFSEVDGNYVFFANGATKIYVDATDPRINDLYDGSGVASITYRLGDSEETTTVEPDENGEFSFDIEPNFKGYVTIIATDKVGNSTAEENKYVTGGIVVEDATHHEANSSLTVEVPTTDKQDKLGQPLYKDNVTIKFNVQDAYAGIKSIDYSVVAPYDTDNNQAGTLNIASDGTYSCTDGARAIFRVDESKNDKNLVTYVDGQLTVTNNSNDILVKLTIEDNCGNKSTRTIPLSIDKTAPRVSIEFDNNSGDPEYSDYYNQDRTATITIKERNFDENLFNLIIDATGASAPSAAWGDVQLNESNPDENTYVCTVKFDQDGDYVMNCTIADMAGNEGTPFAEQKFTIDKTKPVITVEFDNKNAKNGNYYKDKRVATVTVEEHNFDENRVTINGVATGDGTTATFPAISGWTQSGDTYTATITFDQDGTYSFTAQVKDKASNESDVLENSEFIMDLTAPEIEITGVENYSAYNSDVLPFITMTDNNFDGEGTVIALTGSNNGTVNYEYSERISDKEELVAFTNFAIDESVDDIYTLTATAVDKAGNETEEKVEFSVNRFGSVYVLGKEIQGINGTYTNSPVDIKITETNVNELEMDATKLVVTVNGTPVTLEAGKDYTVSESNTATNWCQYVYTIPKSYFTKDGTYMVSLYSLDAAGNENQSIDESKEAEISFGIDTTAPVIVPINIDSNGVYEEANYTANLSINDNLVLENVQVLVNDVNAEYENDGDNYSIAIDSANTKQTVAVIATDAAGNSVAYIADDVVVSTNKAYLIYNNKRLFVSLVAGLMTGVAAAVVFTAKMRKKKVNIKEH